MKIRSLFAVILTLALSAAVSAQRPGQPGGGPPPGGQSGQPGQGPGGQHGPGPRNEWNKMLDTNKDGNVDAAELQSAIDRTFSALDRNSNGVIDGDEGRMAPPPPRGGQPGDVQAGRQRPAGGNGGGREGMDLLPPFFFDKAMKDGSSLTKDEFAAAVKAVFNDMDKNHDGVVSNDEARPPRNGAPDERGQGEPGAPPPPNARFIAAELRFGDKLVAGQPFSAQTVIEDTRRLYDGSTVTRTMNGAIYRDGAGRTRREQPLEMIGGVQVQAANGQPQVLVFINDFAAKTQTFLDTNSKVARTHPIGNLAPPADGPHQPADAKVESLGSKSIDGVKVDGTRTTFQIPAGQLGDKAIDVVTETWFSPDLQVVVMSRHLDPIAGEHVFRLTNIKLAEPAADLFTVPQGYRVETGDNRPRREE